MDISKSKMIGKFLENYRLRSGLSPSDVCQFLNIESTKLLFQYEAGVQQTPLYLIYAFANMYEIPGNEVIELFYKLTEFQSAECSELSADIKGS